MGRPELELPQQGQEERPVSIAAGADAIGRAPSTVRKWIAAGEVRCAVLGKGAGRGNGSLVLISDLRHKLGEASQARRSDKELLDRVAEALWDTFKRDSGVYRDRVSPALARPIHKVLEIPDYAAAGLLLAAFERLALALTGSCLGEEESPEKIRLLVGALKQIARE